MCDLSLDMMWYLKLNLACQRFFPLISHQFCIPSNNSNGKNRWEMVCVRFNIYVICIFYQLTVPHKSNAIKWNATKCDIDEHWTIERKKWNHEQAKLHDYKLYHHRIQVSLIDTIQLLFCFFSSLSVPCIREWDYVSTEPLLIQHFFFFHFDTIWTIQQLFECFIKEMIWMTAIAWRILKHRVKSLSFLWNEKTIFISWRCAFKSNYCIKNNL